MNASTIIIRKVLANGFSMMQGDTIKAKSVRSTAFQGLGTFADRLLRLLRNAILARILAPELFGVMAIVMTTSLLFEYFTEVGVRQSVIHSKRGAESSYLNMAWWFQFVRGVVLFLIAFIAAPLVEMLYEQPDLSLYLRVAFLSILFNSLISTRYFLLQKTFKFGRVTLINQGSGILATIFTVIMAFWMRNIWALVIGFTIQSVIKCIVSYIICPFIPKIYIHRESLMEIFTYAKGMFGLPILAYLSYQIDILVLGKVVDKSQLGMYALAIALARAPADAFTRIFTPVLLSFYAEKQDDRLSQRRAVLGLTKGIAIFGMPLMVFLILLAKEVLTIVYTSNYARVSLTFMLLVGFSFIMALSIVPAALYQGIGRPYLHRRFVIIRILIMVLFIYPTTLYIGLSGAAATVLTANIVAIFVQIFQMKQLTDITFRRYFLCLSFGFYPAIAVLIPTALIHLTLELSPLWEVIYGGICCVIVWIASFFYILQQKERPTTI